MASVDTYRTDWLSAQPVFYNDKTGKISHCINDVIDFGNIEFHPEGLCNYLDYGYSVFGQTPLKNVRILMPNSEITQLPGGGISVHTKEDETLAHLGKTSHEDDVLHMLNTNINQWANNTEGEIILPVSGGYDSRLMAIMLKEKERVRSFTYGISEKQEDSFEVVKARIITEKLGIKWQFIPLGYFHHFFDAWDKLYGPSTHAHGMYHMEFYTKLKPLVNGHNPFLSGIVGDIWAGNWNFDSINSPDDLMQLSKSHGMNADSSACLLHNNKEIINAFFEDRKTEFKDPSYRIISSVRNKIILLSYLTNIPAHFGFKPWSPYLSMPIAMAMLNLPPERRENRIWQSEFFKKHKLDLENKKIDFAWENTLNLQALRNVPPPPLNIPLFKELFKPEYIKWINNMMAPKSLHQKVILSLLQVKGTRGLLYRMGYRNNSFEKQTGELLKAYFAYLTLKPIEYLLIKRNIFAKTIK